MKKILTVSGSVRKESSNVRFLDAIPSLFSDVHINRYDGLERLPLFVAQLEKETCPQVVLDWKNAIQNADAIIISTPEYIHNLPALIKNALEWVTASGEFHHKKVLAITFTPNEPRGEKAMQSLLWSLQALDAQIVAQLPLYQNEIEFEDNNRLVENESLEMLKEAIKLLK